ncbi:MAG TPA: ankyrin repeat domain-containing protein [Gallionella sp.]
MSNELFDSVKAHDAGRVQKLLAGGSDVNARDGEGGTALMLAAHSGSLPIVEILLKAGADVNAAEGRGWTALMKAMYNHELKRGFADVAQALIDAGADIEAPVTYGVRPLMMAAGYGETEVVETLLEAGADVTARNEGGFTALMMVKQKHYIDVINLLHQAEQLAGVGEGSCSTKHMPGSNAATFLKPEDKP